MPNTPTVIPPRISGFDYVRPLGSGGFAHVYQYEQNMPRRAVAVKVLTGGDRADAVLGSPEDRAAFEAEADAMAKLSSHPSIVSIFAASVSTDGRPYIAMEFCPESFRNRSNGMPSQLHEVLDAGVRLAGALETAHAEGILHRDIKPSNVLIAATGRPMLADFGIVSLSGQMRGEGTSEAMSIPWAAPEVIAKDTTGTVASEIWSLGATLYTFAAGRSPFARQDGAKDTRDAMSSRIRKARYTPVPGAQGYHAFDTVIGKALSQTPGHRYASMREFGETLQQLQRHYGYDVTPLDIVDPHWQRPVAPAQANGQPQAQPPGGVRGPVVSSVQGAGSRAHRRAELARQQETALPDRAARRAQRGAGTLKPVLIGVAAAVAVLAVGVGVFALTGGF